MGGEGLVGEGGWFPLQLRLFVSLINDMLLSDVELLAIGLSWTGKANAFLWRFPRLLVFSLLLEKFHLLSFLFHTFHAFFHNFCCHLLRAVNLWWLRKENFGPAWQTLHRFPLFMYFFVSRPLFWVVKVFRADEFSQFAILRIDTCWVFPFSQFSSFYYRAAIYFARNFFAL